MSMPPRRDQLKRPRARELLINSHPLRECIELVSGDQFRELVCDHKLGRDGGSSRLDKFPGEMVPYADMLGSWVRVWVQRECERTLVVAIGVQY